MLDEVDITLGWGEIFIPTAESKNLDIQTAVMAKQMKTRVQILYFWINNQNRNGFAHERNRHEQWTGSDWAWTGQSSEQQKPFSALIELCQKNNRPDLLLILLDGLNEEK